MLPALPPAQRRWYLEEAVRRGHTHFAFDLEGGPGNPYVRRLPAFNLSNDPAAVREFCVEIASYGLIPFPFLITQEMLRSWSMEQIRQFAHYHAAVWGENAGAVWGTFEQEEAVPLGEEDFNGSGMRGDFYLAQVGRELRAAFPECPVFCHFAREIDWYSDKWGKGDSFHGILYQFPEYDPRGLVEHVDKHIYGDEEPRVIPASEALLRDWRHTLQRGGEEAPEVVYVPAEYFQIEDGVRRYPSWSDEEAWDAALPALALSAGMRGNGP